MSPFRTNIPEPMVPPTPMDTRSNRVRWRGGGGRRIVVVISTPNEDDGSLPLSLSFKVTSLSVECWLHPLSSSRMTHRGFLRNGLSLRRCLGAWIGSCAMIVRNRERKIQMGLDTDGGGGRRRRGRRSKGCRGARWKWEFSDFQISPLQNGGKGNADPPQQRSLTHPKRRETSLLFSLLLLE